MNKRLLSMFLALCMVLTMLPVSVMAEEAPRTIGGGEEIIAFASLAQTEKTVTVGTSLEDLELPEILTATVRTNPDFDMQADTNQQTVTDRVYEESLVDIPVTWTSQPEYDMDTEGVYVFTPVIKGYTLRAELPEITVTVGTAMLRGMMFSPMSTNVAKIGTTEYATLQAAVDEVADGQTIQLLDDITLTNSITIPNGNNISFTLDLNDKTLDGGSNSAIRHGDSGALTIVDSGSEGMIKNNVDSPAISAIKNEGTGSVIISGGTVLGNGAGIYNQATGTVAVSSGTVSGNRGILNYSSGSVIVSGGTVSGVPGSYDFGIQNNGIGSVIISGGIVQSSTSNAIYANPGGNITISGDAQVISGSVGGTIRLWRTGGTSSITLTIEGGTIENSSEGGSAISTGGTTAPLTVNISIPFGKSAIVKGGGQAMPLAPTLINSIVEASQDVSGTPTVDYNAEDIAIYKYLKFEPAPYDVWVGGTRVTSANAGNVLGNGTVSYTPAVGDTRQTLTLNNANITQAYEVTQGSITSKYGIYATSDLNLVLEGDSTIGGSSLDTNDGHSSGVQVNGNLNISGTGSISATGGSIDKNTSYQSSGISSNNNTVTISGGTITAIGGTTTQSAASYGIYSSVLVNGGTVNATGGTSGQNTSGISGNNFAMDGGTVIATGGSSGQYSLGINAVNNFNVSGGNVTATAGSGGQYSLGINAPSNFNVSGGNVTAISHTAGTRAVNKAPNLTSYPNVQITASTNANGSEESVIDNTTLVNNINTYKYLKFEPVHQLLLSFDSQGGSPVASLEVAHGNTITAPTAPTKYGYTFEGWYKDVAGTNQWNFATDSVTEATTLYAKWSMNQHTVVFDSQGGSPVAVGGGADYTLISAPVAPTKEGHTFGGWYKEATCVNEWNFAVDRIVGDRTLYAKWIRRASENADLSNLALSNGILSPIFDSNRTSYSVSVVNSSTNVTITPTVVDSTATVTVNGDPVASGNPSGVINLNVGANRITVVVTAEDGSTKTYAIEITRQASIAPPPQNPPSGDGGGGSGSGGGGSSSNSSTSLPDNRSHVIVTPPSPDNPNSPTQGEIKVLGIVDGNGNVIVNITDKTVTDAFNKALEDAKKNGNEENGIILVLRVDTGNRTGFNVIVNLPRTVQDTIIENRIVNTIVVVDNPDISIGMDLATVEEINKQANSDVNITATPMDNHKLTEEAKDAIGYRPVFDLKVNYGNGQQVQSFGAGSVSVTIPYTLGENEKAENVQAVYVDSNGKVHWLVNSVYDSVEKVLRFSTNHFSTYGVGYKQTNTELTTTFTDIGSHWAKENIEFVVSRGFFSGTSDTTFSPNTAMTRGMFVTTLGKLAKADVTDYKQSSFTDVKSDAYYMGYIEWANQNSIVRGTGNGKFAPDQSITRQQMALIMQKYAKVMGFTLPKVREEKTFGDDANISAYAKDAVKEMQMTGVISGKNDNLFDPQGTATRAEVSTVLRRFVELWISGDTM